ncbi:MAG: methyltransferase domain-containing protein [Anaerolineales bacterium]|nr:methyltransferase domain-containing protein [Anaerolineales bacterium]
MDPSRYQDKDYLRGSQYKDSGNLNARAQLHARFSTSAVDWQPWVFDQLRLAAGSRVLECGCGPGWLWRANLDRIPAGCQITLTDLSAGMVAEARAALAGSGHAFRFQTADVQALPFDDASFDVIVANHMLYHVPDLARALAELRRVLAPGGRLHAVTNGARHMAEVKALRRELAAELGLPLRDAADFVLPFRLENGRELLAPWFEKIELIPFEDSLRVTEAAPLVAYALSADEARAALDAAQLATVEALVAERIAAGGGAIEITKAVGMFVAEKMVIG